MNRLEIKAEKKNTFFLSSQFAVNTDHSTVSTHELKVAVHF